MTKTTIFTEAIDLTEAQLDTDNRVLRGVVLIRAGASANGREYPASVLQNSVGVFEEVSAFMNHPTKEQIKSGDGRGMQEFTGVYKNVRFENNMLVADRVFSKNAAGQDALAIAEDVVSGVLPRSAVGLSINAMGRARKTDNKVIVEAITAAESVDDVVRPAAGGSYLESAGDGLAAAYEAAFIEGLTYEQWLALREEFPARFRKEHRQVRRTTRLAEVTEARDRYKARCETLQAEKKSFQEARDAALAEAAVAKRVVLVMETLAKVTLPTSWRDSLRNRLLEAEPDTWDAIIADEQTKAQDAGVKVRPTVTGSGQRVMTVVETRQGPPAVNWSQVKTPEDQARVLQKIQEGKLSWQ